MKSIGFINIWIEFIYFFYYMVIKLEIKKKDKKLSKFLF